MGRFDLNLEACACQGRFKQIAFMDYCLTSFRGYDTVSYEPLRFDSNNHQLDQRMRRSRRIEPGGAHVRSKKLDVSLALIVAINFAAGAVFAAEGKSASGAVGEQSSASSAALEEITVTAEKRAVNVQKIAGAVTVVTGEDLVNNGATDIRAVVQLTPSVRFGYESNVAQQFIRGIGSNLDYAWVPESVALNVNGVQITRFASMSTLFDVERVELAAGPQGTLYGGSASGGVINIATRRPTANQEASVLLDVGNYGTLNSTLVGNMPINDRFKLRAALNVSRHDAYQSIGSDDDSAVSGRLSALFDPNDKASVYLWASFYQDRARPAAPWIITPGVSDVWKIPQFGFPFGIPAGGLFPGSPAISYPANDLSAGRAEYRAFMAGGQVDFHLNGFTLSYLPSAVVYSDHDLRVIAGFNQTFDVNIHSYAQELRATSDNDSALQWIGGLYWQKNATLHRYLFGAGEFGPFLSGGTVPDDRTNYSAYGQGTYSATQALRFTVGGRFSRDKTKADDAVFVYPTCAAPLFCSDGRFVKGTLPYSVDRSWTRFDWKVGAEFDVTPKSLLYASVQTGYNPGTFNPQPSTQAFDNIVKPQTLTSFTIGSKNRFLDDRLQVNDELYYYDYKDLIVATYSAATGANAYFNAPKSRIYGNELTGIFLATPDDQINLGIGLLHAKIKEFANNGTDYSGSQLMYSPQVTVTLGFQHTQNLRSGGSVVANVSSHYENGFYTGDSLDHALNPTLFQKAFTTTNASLMYHGAGDKWSIGIWGKNLENKGVLGAGAPVAPGVAAGFYEPPRTYGLRFEMRQ